MSLLHSNRDLQVANKPQRRRIVLLVAIPLLIGIIMRCSDDPAVAPSCQAT